jgi:hypothetical protein
LSCPVLAKPNVSRGRLVAKNGIFLFYQSL